MAAHTGAIATAACGLFAGAALYANVVDVPAMYEVGLQQFTQFHAKFIPRAAKLQGSLAVVGSIAAATKGAVGSHSGKESKLWLASAGLLFAVLPLTFWKIFPVNKEIADAAAKGEVADKEKFETWNKLHAVRTGLAITALTVMVFASCKKVKS